MPQRPWSCHFTSRYCCATVRNALLICTVALTLSRAVFALLPRYGSTAVLVSWIFDDGVKRTRPVGLMQLISSAICFDRPSTTAVEHVPVVYDDTVASCSVELTSGSSATHPVVAAIAMGSRPR